MAQSVNTTVLDGIFCAGGDAKFDMQGNIGAMWCFSVPLGFLAAFWLKLPLRTKEAELYLAMLEASAKYLHVPKYRIYTVEELFDLVKEKYEKKDNKEAVPYFTELLLAMGKEE